MLFPRLTGVRRLFKRAELPVANPTDPAADPDAVRRGDAAFRWASGFYASERVEHAALLLQDRSDVDVVALLWTLFRLSGGETVAAGSLDVAMKRVAPWQREVIGPLREARRAMKRMKMTVGPFHLRDEIKRLELQAERFQFTLLAQSAGESAAIGGAKLLTTVHEIAAFLAGRGLDVDAIAACADLAVELNTQNPDRHVGDADPAEPLAASGGFEQVGA